MRLTAVAVIDRVLAAASSNRDASDAFAGLVAGTVSPVEFFAPENVDAIFEAARSTVVV